MYLTVQQVMLVLSHNAYTHTTVLQPFFRDHPGDQCQKRTSGLHGARED